MMLLVSAATSTDRIGVYELVVVPIKDAGSGLDWSIQQVYGVEPVAEVGVSVWK